MTKTELRKMRKNKLLKLAKKEKVKLPEKVLKPELIDIMYRHFQKKEAEATEKKASVGKRKPASRRKSSAGRKDRGKVAGSGLKSSSQPPPAESGEENGRTIRQKAVSGKYYLEKESGRVILKEEKENLPGYDITRIETLVRDPRCIFTYWEISASDIKSIADSFGKVWNECRLVLRVYNIGHDRDRSVAFDIDIPFNTDNWYIDVYPETRYQVGVGVISPEGIYTEISLSGEVETPRETVSDYQDKDWARPGHLIERIIDASGDVYFRAGGGRATSGMPLRPISSESVSSFGATGSGRKKGTVSAELVIHGVAGEDTTISIYENEIIPGDDGSFTIRMELSDGEVEIPIKLSSEGERIEKNIVAAVKTREPSED
ncbi:MAG: DUF4912 domain-containing protein [Candidatus Latescibacteria bacterium]|nr:DUF4912 domain-containing protein [bacterium]MBD3422862.1 DUF4912 domain-containing protein [Candidatus Latescibacterota bacterium]